MAQPSHDRRFRPEILLHLCAVFARQKRGEIASLYRRAQAAMAARPRPRRGQEAETARGRRPRTRAHPPRPVPRGRGGTKRMTPPRSVLSLRWIITGAAIALTSVSVVGMGSLAERNARRALTEQIQTRLVLEARNLALMSSRALLDEFPELTLTPILVEIRDKQPELAFAVVVDHREIIRGHADARRIGQKFTLPGNLGGDKTVGEIEAAEMLVSNAALLVASAPVRHPGGERIGTALVAMQQAYIDELLEKNRRKQIVLVASLLFLGIVTSVVLVWVLLRPIQTLREGLERIGRGDLETPVRLKGRTELGLLAETMNEMARRLRDAQAEAVEKERLTHEVELAREIQSSLLPATSLKAGEFVIDGAQQSAAEVGGDYYDILPLADGRVGVAIADVSGKGLAGCLVTSMLSALLRAFRDTETSPSALLVRLERDLVNSLRPGTFITMFYGILDPRAHKLTFASAGHSPLLVWRAKTGKHRWFKTDGIPLGAVRNGALARTLRDRTIRLGPGDVAVQYTDGVNEAFDRNGDDQFGFDRLAAATAAAAREGCRAVLDRVRREVRAWSGESLPADDETLLVIGREGVGPAAETSPAAPATNPTALLERARERGHHLPVPVDLGRLDRIRPWIARCPGLTGLEPRETNVVELGLYEACANIVEHGYGENPSRGFDLWWMPDHADGSRARGFFVLVDQGRPFRPDGPPNVDLADPAVRRRGRGLGLEIIHGAMGRVSYHPGTPAGNVTILGFDPERIRTEEVFHG